MIPDPNLQVIHPDTGQAFALSDEGFSRWWAATVLPEDQTEYVHLYRGGIEEARYVCAVDYLTNVLGEDYGAEVIIKSYFLAKNLPVDMTDAQGKVNATYLNQSDAVRFLLDRVRLRSRRIAEERIANRTAAKIEELYERSAGLDGKEQLDTERAALETAIKFLGNQARERGQEADRRAKKAAQDAITKGQEHQGDMKRLPSLAEARLHIAMLIDGYGADAILAIAQDHKPEAISGETSG